MITMPTAHILMPLYNSEKYLAAAMNSALQQSYPDKKLLIINDGSTDNSLKTAREFLENHPEFKQYVILESKPANRGVSRTRQDLLALSKQRNPAAYLFWLDADDQYTDTNLIQDVINQMQKTKAEICLYNFSVIFEDENQKANAAGLLKEKQNMAKILDRIHQASAAVKPLEIDNLLEFTSLGWTKAYAPTVKWPKPADCPFEDFAYMANLLTVKSITALPAIREPIQYLRRSSSICGQRKSENFTQHIPMQLKCFFNIICENTNDAEEEHFRKLRLAQHFITRKLDQYTDTLNNIIKTQSFPDINQQTLKIFKQHAEGLRELMASKMQNFTNLLSLTA